MPDLDQSIRLHQAADHEPDPEIKYPVLAIAILSIAAWLAVIGAGYAVWRAVEALSG